MLSHAAAHRMRPRDAQSVVIFWKDVAKGFLPTQAYAKAAEATGNTIASVREYVVAKESGGAEAVERKLQGYLERQRKSAPTPGSPAWHRLVPRPGTLQWAYDVLPLPPGVAVRPWAVPGPSSRCDAQLAKPPRIFVVLTASVRAFVNLKRRGLRNQQRNESERRAVYERSVQRWAEDTNIPVVFVENSGADLSSIRGQVPSFRRDFEFLNVAPWPERLPDSARSDVGRMEAQAVISALNSSALLATRCAHDVVFKVTGRFFVRDFVPLIRRQCLRGHLRHPERSPLIMVQKPSWEHAEGERGPLERETQVMGFDASFAADVLGWAATPIAATEWEYIRWQIGSEVQLGKLATRLGFPTTNSSVSSGLVEPRELNGAGLNSRVCQLPPLPVLPVREGSTGKLRESI